MSEEQFGASVPPEDVVRTVVVDHAIRHWPDLGVERHWHLWRFDKGWRVAPEGEDLQGRIGFPCLVLLDDGSLYEESSSTPPDVVFGRGHGHLDGRNTNSVDCVRAVEANWRGQGAKAAAAANPRGKGLPVSHIEDWAEAKFKPTTLETVGQELTTMGPGASAMIVSMWEGPGGRAFNAINDRGAVKFVDGQTGETAPWPPPFADRAHSSSAIMIGTTGVPVS